MKNKGLVIKTIFGAFVLLAAVLTGLYIKNNLILNRTYGYATGVTNIAQYVDEENINASSASFVFENIDPVSKETIKGNKVRIYSNDENIDITFLDTETNEEVPVNNNVVALSETGITVKIDGIEKGNTYDINVEPVELNRGYKPTYKRSTITLDYTNVLSAYIKEIIGVDNNPMEVSEQDKIVFLYTDENDKIRLRANEDIDIEYTYSLDELSEEELNEAHFDTYDKNNYLKVSTNGYLYAKAKYRTSAYTKISMLHITNIDKLNPTGEKVSIVESNDHLSATITVRVGDQEGTKEYGKSDVAKYAITKFYDITDSEWIEGTAGEYTTTVEDNGLYYLHVMDGAGNTTVVDINVEEITFRQDGYYVLILSSTNVDLVGRVYNTLMDMKADFDAHNLTNNDEVIAQIEGDIKNQYIDVENVNLTLDLNGYILESREETPTFNIKDGAKLTIVDNKYQIDEFIATHTAAEFDYTGKEKKYIVPGTGTYKLEAWGAQGGGSRVNATIKENKGYGGYSTGIVTLNKNDIIYINVGGKGTDGIVGENAPGGYNGGGIGTWDHGDDDGAGAGGGATHIATEKGLLTIFEDKQDKLLIVAGGGGGRSWNTDGGSGGGFEAGAAGDGRKATQTSGYVFGKGQSATGNGNGNGHGGGGGGYYGGYESSVNGDTTDFGGGGSGYIGNTRLTSKYMYCYNCTESDEESTKTTSTTDYSANALSNTPKAGNGFVRITPVDADIQLIDYYDYSLFRHGENYGTVKNVNYDAIVVNPGATLQLGEENSPDLAHIEYPDHHSPYISGKGKAITNRGTFDYYDGVVYGGIALDGDVQDTPHIYDPSVSLTDDQRNYIMTLEKVTNVEALIGKTRYTLLEDAIDVANRRKGTPADQIKIDIVNDLTKDLIIEVNDQKNIILDLNGHSFTNTITDPVIVNHGKLVIMDSGDTGVIAGHNDVTIKNEYTGQLTIDSGSVTNDKDNSNTILNYNDGTLTINNGTFSKENKGSVIFNQGGIVTINDGTFHGRTGDNGADSSSVINNCDNGSTDTIDSYQNITFDNIKYDSSNNKHFILSDGVLKPDNTNSGTYYSYFELDLTSYNEDDYLEVEMDIDVNVRDIDSAYANVMTYAGSGNYDSNRLYSLSTSEDTTYKTLLNGGKLYYLNIGYFQHWRNDSFPEGGNKVEIKSIKVNRYHTYHGRLTINEGTFDTGAYCYYNHSYYAENIINGGYYNCYYSTYTKNGDVQINGGTFPQHTWNDQGMKYFITGGEFNEYVNYKGYIYMSGGRVKNINNSSWNIYNVNGLNIVTITGGEIYGDATNLGTMNISNAKVTGVVYHKSPVDMRIDNTTFEKNFAFTGRNDSQYCLNITSESENVYVSNSTFEMNLLSFEYSGNLAGNYPIYKENNSNLAIENTSITVTGTNRLSRDRYEYEIGDFAYGIYNKGDGLTYLDKVNINVQSSKPTEIRTYGIYSIGKGDVYIGKKDSNYELNRNTIQSNVHALFIPQSKIYYYDGVIKSEGLASDDSFYENETGYYINRYDNNGIDTIEQNTTNNGRVLNVGTNVTYNTLGDALDDAGTEAKLRFISDYAYETINKTYEIKSNQNITIDLNGKRIYLGASYINNGQLKFIDESNTTSRVKTQSFINNNEMNVEAGNFITTTNTYAGITNNGVLRIKNSSFKPVYEYRKEFIIENNNELYINEGSYFTIDTDLTAGIIKNNYTGKVYFNDGTLDATSVPDTPNTGSMDGRVLYNEGGYVELNGGTIVTESVSNNRGTVNSIYNTTVVPEFTDVSGTSNDNNLLRHLYWASSIIPLDLTDYTGEVNVEIIYSLVDVPTAKFYFWISEDETFPTDTTTSFASDDEIVTNGTISTTVAGGKKYYIYTHSDNSRYSAMLYFKDIIASNNDKTNHLFKRGHIVLNDTTINGYGNLHVIYGKNSIFTMNGGSIKNAHDTNLHGLAIDLEYGSDIYMNGGLIDNKCNGIQLTDLSAGTITNGSITTVAQNNTYCDAKGIYLKQSVLNIEDIDIDLSNTGSNYGIIGIDVDNASSLNMTGGDVKVYSTYRNVHGIQVLNDSKVSLNNVGIDVEFRNTSSNTWNEYNSYGIYNNKNNTITVGNSSIIAKATQLKSYGIYSEGSSAPTITISNNDTDADGFVSQTIPLIQGNNTGIYRQGGVFNFYDGIIKGETQIYGGVSDRPEGYELKYGNDGTLNTVVLERMDVVENIDTGVKYSTLQSAFNNCTSGELCNLKVLYNIILPNEQLVDTNKKVSLDLNNMTVSVGENKQIINKGELHVKNGTLEVQSIQNEQPIIDNYGTLYTETGIIMNQNTFIKSRLLYNRPDGRIYINAGTFNATQTPDRNNSLSIDGRIFYNEGGYVEMNDGIINTESVSYSTGNERAIINKTVIPEIAKDDTNYNINDYQGSGAIEADVNNDHGCIPINLLTYTGDVTINIKYFHPYSSDFKLFLSEDTTNPSYNSTENLVATIDTYTIGDELNITATGGKKYYLHLVTRDSWYLFIRDITISQNDESTSLFKRAKFVMNGGTINDTGYHPIITAHNADVIVNGGTINGDLEGNSYGTAIFGQYGANITMNNGTINNKNSAIRLEYCSNGLVTNGNFNTPNHGGGGRILASYNSTLQVDNLTLTYANTDYNAEHSGIYTNENSILVMNGGTIDFKSYNRDSHAISINDGTTATIKNVNVSAGGYQNGSSGDYAGMAIYISGTPTISIANSTITGTNDSYKSYGIYSDGKAAPTITLSNNDTDADGSVSQTSSIISGKTYGIYRRGGYVNFYDGIIKGNVPNYGGISNRPENYNLKYGNDGTLNTIVLEKFNVVQNTDTGISYPTLQAAFNSCSDNVECHLKQIYDDDLPKQTVLLKNKIVHYDLDGHTVNAVNNEPVNNIVNYGELHIKNGTLNVQAIQNDSAIIDNNGKLYVETGIIMDQNTFIKSRFLHNRPDAEMYINGGTFTALEMPDRNNSLSVDGRIIYNEGGYVEFNDGTVNTISDTYSSGTAIAIYNKSVIPELNKEANGNIKEDNGTIQVNPNYTRGCIPVDLTGYTGEMEIDIRYVYRSEGTVKAWVTNDTTKPDANSVEGLIGTASGRTYDGHFRTTVNGGSIYYIHLHTGNGWNFYLTDVVVSNNNTTINLFKKATFIMNGGTINSSGGREAIVGYNANINFNGGLIDNANGTEVNGVGIKGMYGSIVNMRGNSEIRNKRLSIHLDELPTFNMSGGLINDTGYINSSILGVYIDNYGAAVNMSGGTININPERNNGYHVDGIYVENGADVKITGGTIYTYRPEATSSNPSAGIYGNMWDSNSVLNLTLGDNDGRVDQNSPHITGDTYGIYLRRNSGNFNFYDGRITSSNSQINGEVDDIPQDYQIVQQSNDYFLDIRSSIENTFEYNKMYFEGLNMPIELIKKLDDKTGTIKLWNDSTIHTQVVIPEGVNITIALEGHELDVEEGIDIGIINNGTLTILDGYGEEIDSGTESAYVNLHGVAIQNNGTLTIGTSGNPNRNSPHIKGTTAITGNSATLLSGKIESTEGGIIQTVGAFLTNLFTFEFAPSSYSYQGNNSYVHSLSDSTILATSPSYRSIESLVDWTNGDINVGMTSHNVGIVDLNSTRDENDTKEIEYTIEVYKNGILDEFYTYRKVIDVQYLADDTLDVDLDWFIDCENKFKNYYLTKMTINDSETKEIPIIVQDGTLFKLYYGQTKGDEIELINPKTGRSSYKVYFLFALIAAIIAIAFMMSKYIKHMTMKEDTI